MCRLLGVVSSEVTDFGFALCRAPRSLALLSREHPDGWGLAVHDGVRGWDVHRYAACAGDDPRFEQAAGVSRGAILIAHIRRRTVGPVGVSNTHPFRAGRWVFAHNGTLDDLSLLESQTSPERLAGIRGDTDSERLFAYLLTAIDCAAPKGAEQALLRATSALAAHGHGSANFVLSDGAVLYAYRFGRTLYLLERGQNDEVRASRRSLETGAVLETGWSSRRTAVLVASERMTDEPWQEIADRTLVRVDLEPVPRWEIVSGGVEPALVSAAGA